VGEVDGGPTMPAPTSVRRWVSPWVFDEDRLQGMGERDGSGQW
jgi:hypothetical protein